MNKLFDLLLKPAKWIFIICGAVIAIAFAIAKAKLIGSAGSFVPVLSSIIVFVVGTLLLIAAPVLLLLKRENEAKMVFIFMLGYWLIWYTQRNLELGSIYAPLDNVVIKLAGIFSFLVALALVAVLVLTVLELAFKKDYLRYFSILVIMAAVVLGFFAALFFFIAAINNGGWEGALQNILIVLGYTFTVFFGYLYFFGAPKAQK